MPRAGVRVTLTLIRALHACARSPVTEYSEVMSSGEDELQLPDLYEAAARARINERCALSYIHDVRGSMQALFSAVELLGRSAKIAGGNQERIHKACDLARRAITHHEKATLDALQALTFQDAEPVAINVLELVNDVVHFLRHDAAVKELTVTVRGESDTRVSAERAKFQTLLVGLLTATIDAARPATELRLSVDRIDDNAVITIGADAVANAGHALPPASLNTQELTLLFARRFLAAQGGRLDVNAEPLPQGSLRVIHPLLV